MNLSNTIMDRCQKNAISTNVPGRLWFLFVIHLSFLIPLLVQRAALAQIPEDESVYALHPPLLEGDSSRIQRTPSKRFPFDIPAKSHTPSSQQAWTAKSSRLPQERAERMEVYGYLDGVTDCNRNGRDDDFDLLPGQLNFSETVGYSQGGYDHNSFGLAITDFNLDGYQDIATGRIFDKDIYIRLNQGDGSLAQEMDLIFGKLTVSLAVGDLNNDTYPDLIATSWWGVVGLFMNKGMTGSEWQGFEPVHIIDGGGKNDETAVADFDGDGDLDLAVGDAFYWNTGVEN